MIESGFQSGAFNMALDEALFRMALEESDFVPTLRIYGFRHPTITYGYSQQIPQHWLDDPFYESSRRITGGGLVFHGKDLTYSFVSPLRFLADAKSLANSYRAFHEIVQAAFLKVKIVVEFYMQSVKVPSLRNLCFLAPVKNDLLFHGKKIAGSAQKRSQAILLHQGSVNFRVFLNGDDGYLAFFENFKSAFLLSFQEYFKVDFMVQSASGFQFDDQLKDQLKEGGRLDRALLPVGQD